MKAFIYYSGCSEARTEMIILCNPERIDPINPRQGSPALRRVLSSFSSRPKSSILLGSEDPPNISTPSTQSVILTSLLVTVSLAPPYCARYMHGALLWRLTRVLSDVVIVLCHNDVLSECCQLLWRLEPGHCNVWCAHSAPAPMMESPLSASSDHSLRHTQRRRQERCCCVSEIM